jgi:hypothetical protein
MRSFPEGPRDMYLSGPHLSDADNHTVNFRRILAWLLAGALFLPIAIVLIAGLARLLAALEDADGARLLDRAALVAGLLWALTLIGLPIALALESLSVTAPHDEDETEE